jgi:hypothetical protein
MERKLVIKNSDGLYTIYLTIFSKVLVKRVVFNFYIYKELFDFISLTLKIFYASIFIGNNIICGYIVTCYRGTSVVRSLKLLTFPYSFS